MIISRKEKKRKEIKILKKKRASMLWLYKEAKDNCMSVVHMSVYLNKCVFVSHE
jgi:hypothetical protein